MTASTTIVPEMVGANQNVNGSRDPTTHLTAINILCVSGVHFNTSDLNIGYIFEQYALDKFIVLFAHFYLFKSMFFCMFVLILYFVYDLAAAITTRSSDTARRAMLISL